jgi:hypothetical protein
VTLCIVFVPLATAHRQSTAGGFSISKFRRALSRVLSFGAEDSIWEGLFGEAYSGLEVLVLLVRHVPQRLPFQYGRTLLNLFFMPVPRAWWPGKPVAVGRTVALVFFPGRGGGPTTPLMAELYLNFHVPGIIVGMLVLGVIARALSEYRRRAPRNAGMVLVYVLGALWIVQLVRASFGLSTTTFLKGIIPVVLVQLLVGERSSPRGSSCDA